VKKINLLWTNSRGTHYTMNELNPTYVDSSCQGKAHPNFIKLAQRFGTIIMPPRTPTWNERVFGPNPSIN
jgi:hypothetical protein